MGNSPAGQHIPERVNKNVINATCETTLPISREKFSTAEAIEQISVCLNPNEMHYSRFSSGTEIRDDCFADKLSCKTTKLSSFA